MRPFRQNQRWLEGSESGRDAAEALRAMPLASPPATASRRRGSWWATAFVAGSLLQGNPALAADLPPPAQGRVLLEASFEEDNALRRWSGDGKLDAGFRSRSSLGLEAQPGAAASTMASIPLPVEAARGCLVRGTAMLRASEVSPKPNPWNGIKFMLALEAPDRRLWPQADVGTGSFEWHRLSFTTRVPTNATRATLLLGLEAVSGRVWFDDVQITIAKPPAPRPPARPPAATSSTGSDAPRRRGAMVSPEIDAAGLRVLGRDWGANLIRWQLIRHGRPGERASTDDYDAWLERELRRLDAALPECQDSGLQVVLDLHSPPGGKATSSGYVGSDDRLFTDPSCQDHLVRVWQRMATRYRGARAIWGFDLANEPVEDLVGEDCDDWQALAERTARAVRAIDPTRTLIVEPSSWGGPAGFSDLSPLPLSNVVYSVHMYVPHAFTHQGVGSRGPNYAYPGLIEGKRWDKAELERALQPVLDFQRAYGVPIYVGEFSAIRWAPDGSAARYLSDLIELFESRGWDWSYHAFREWHGWSVEHGADRDDAQPAAQPTDRQALLRRWFRLNAKPAR